MFSDNVTHLKARITSQMCLATTLSYNSFQPLNLLGVLKVCMCAHIFICFTAHARTYISVCVCVYDAFPACGWVPTAVRRWIFGVIPLPAGPHLVNQVQRVEANTDPKPNNNNTSRHKSATTHTSHSPKNVSSIKGTKRRSVRVLEGTGRLHVQPSHKFATSNAYLRET